jgi:hypothetical protein
MRSIIAEKLFEIPPDFSIQALAEMLYEEHSTPQAVRETLIKGPYAKRLSLEQKRFILQYALSKFSEIVMRSIEQHDRT